jgi:S1-C subfamily serine protease
VAAVASEPPPEGSAWLGVRLGTSAGPGEGVTISRVFVDGPAERGGLRGSDVIQTFDGEPVRDARDLIGKIQARGAGAWVPVTVLRQGDELELDVRLVARPETIDLSGLRHGWIGVEAIDLPESLREHFGAPPAAGVMIADVAAGSPAEAAGFRLGDVVYEVDGQPVRSVRDLQERVQSGGVGNDYPFLVARDGALLELETRVAAAP